MPEELKAKAGRTRTSAVYEQIRKDILNGGLRPGERLRVEQLRSRYEAGGSPVREALNRLSAQGLVDSEENRGFCVPQVSKADLLEVYRTRCWLEELALRESIRHGDELWEESLLIAEHRLSRTPRCLDENNGVSNPEWERLHREFHMKLIGACQSRWLLRFCEQLHDHADRYRQVAVSADPGRPAQEEHKAIMQATIDRNMAEATELLMAHYTRTQNIILNAEPPVVR